MRKRTMGYVYIILAVLFSCIWIYWGVFENFHEGWYYESIVKNLLLFIFQYLSIAIGIIIFEVVSLKWPKVGLIIGLPLIVWLSYFFSGLGKLVIIIPIVILILASRFGAFKSSKKSILIIIAIPVILAVVLTVPEFIRVSSRVNNQDFSAQSISYNNGTLVWAPSGPGWVEKSITWEEANEICLYLSEDGKALMTEPQGIWRLPTIEEAVSSLLLHNENAGGTWDEESFKASYVMTPDKETPIWHPYSKVIYYWLEDNDESDSKAPIIVYNGGVYLREKSLSLDSLGFRAVKEAVGK